QDAQRLSGTRIFSIRWGDGPRVTRVDQQDCSFLATDDDSNLGPTEGVDQAKPNEPTAHEPQGDLSAPKTRGGCLGQLLNFGQAVLTKRASEQVRPTEKQELAVLLLQCNGVVPGVPNSRSHQDLREEEPHACGC